MRRIIKLSLVMDGVGLLQCEVDDAVFLGDRVECVSKALPKVVVFGLVFWHVDDGVFGDGVDNDFVHHLGRLVFVDGPVEFRQRVEVVE